MDESGEYGSIGPAVFPRRPQLSLNRQPFYTHLEYPRREASKLQFSDYLRIVRRSWVPILTCVLLGLLAAASYSILAQPSYTAQTKLFVAIQGTGSVTELNQGNSFTQARVQSYAKTATTPVVLQPVIEDLALALTAEELAEEVEASAEIDTVLLNISVKNESPVQSAAIAQAIANSLIQVVSELESPESGGPSPIRLSVVAPASPPAEPSSPNLPINLSVGLLLGIVAGAVLALVRAGLDTRVRGEAELRNATDSPVLGGIAYDAQSVNKPLVSDVRHQSPRAEAFRQIRTNLDFAQAGQTYKTILVTSSLPGEGKSVSATNLAISISQTGRSVALVEADLRRPKVSDYLGLEREVGLTTVLVGAVQLDDALQPWGEYNMSVLTSGKLPPNPSELLGSDAMSKLIGALEDRFEVIIIDAPPLLPVTDASVLSQHVGGVLLVADTQQVKLAHIERSISSLRMVNANLMGVLLNKLPGKGPDSYSYSSYESNDAEYNSPSSADRRARRARTVRSR